MAFWLRAFLDEGTPTFFDKSRSAKAAGYECCSENSFAVMGCANFRKMRGAIEAWLDENGLSETALKSKMVKLIDARETKFFQHEGKVTDEREVEALETQRRTLDMALKLKGMYAPEKHTVKEQVTFTLNLFDGEKEQDAD